MEDNGGGGVEEGWRRRFLALDREQGDIYLSCTVLQGGKESLAITDEFYTFGF